MTTTKPDIVEMLKNADDATIKLLSVCLTRLVFRDGVAEDLHAKNAPMDQETMKALNIDVTNRIYSVLKAVVDNDPITIMGLISHIIFGEESRRDWNEPEATLLEDFKYVGNHEYRKLHAKGA